jgi:hypothetical protein
MQPFVFASQRKAVRGFRLDEERDRDVPAAGTARLRAPRKSRGELGRALEALFEDWSPSGISERFHPRAVGGSLRNNVRGVPLLEGGRESPGELDQAPHAGLVPMRVVALKLFHFLYELTGPRGSTRPNQANVKLVGGL